MLGLSPLTLKRPAGLWRNPRAWPAGGAPGFDPTHIAASGGPVRGSYVALPAGVLDVLTGQLGTGNGGAYPFAIFGGAGPVLFGANASNNSFNFANKSAANDSSITLAAIGIIGSSATGTGGSKRFGGSSSSGATGWGIGATSSNSLILARGSTNIAFQAVPTLTPIFLAASINVSSGLAYSVCNNLNTGQITTGSSAGNTTAPSTPNGSHIFNSFNSVAQNGYTAAFAVIAAALGPAELRAWAADPWAFWYPDPLEFDYTGGATAIALSALLRSRSAGAGALIGAAAMQGRSISKASGASAIAGSAAILAQLRSQARATDALVGAAALQTRTSAKTTGTDAITGNAALTARTSGMARAKAGLSGALGLAARMFGAGSERAGPSGAAALQAHVLSVTRATAVLAGRVGLTVLTLVRAAMAGGASFPVLLTGRLIGTGKSRGVSTGAAALSAEGKAQATAAAASSGAVPLAAETRSATTLRGAIVGHVPIIAISALTRGMTTMRAIFTLIAPQRGRAKVSDQALSAANPSDRPLGNVLTLDQPLGSAEASDD